MRAAVDTHPPLLGPPDRDAYLLDNIARKRRKIVRDHRVSTVWRRSVLVSFLRSRVSAWTHPAAIGLALWTCSGFHGRHRPDGGRLGGESAEREHGAGLGSNP